MPFNKGDIVKCISDNKIYYGVIQKELKSKEDDYHFKSNTLFKSYGGSDMVMNLDCYNLSTKSLSLLLLVGCFSFLSALASICLILSLVTPNTLPTSSRVLALPSIKPKRN